MQHLVIGTGPIGTHTAATLVSAGTPVRVGSRRPDADVVAGAERVLLDATDPASLDSALVDVDVLHLCAHATRYRADVWRHELPGLEATVLDAAERHAVTVVFPESLYAFDTDAVVDASSTPTPRTRFGQVRAQLLEQRAQSPARTISVLASDYFGPGAGAQAHAGDRMVGPATSGGTVRPLGRADVVHAWTYLPDLAATMVGAARLPIQDDRHLIAPSLHATQRELAGAFARARGNEDVRVRPVPSALLRAAGMVHRDTRALVETLTMFERPLRVDASATEALLGLSATPLDDAARATVDPSGSAPARAAGAWTPR